MDVPGPVRWLVAATLIAGLAPGLVRAQAPDEAKAKTEGALVYYTSNRTTVAEKHARAFEKKHGIKVQVEDLAKNQPLLTEGHLPGMQLVASGERTVSAEMNDYDARAGLAKGQPIGIVVPEEGTFVIPTPIAVLKGTARPNAARLFVDFRPAPM